MTDRQFTNPLKGTVSPLVKIVPWLCVSSTEIRSQIQLGDVIPISNYTNMKKSTASPQQWLPPIHLKIWFDFSITAGWCGEADIRHLSFLILWSSAIVWSSSALPFLYYSKTSAIWDSNCLELCYPPKLNQGARVRYQIRLHAVLLGGAADQCSPLSNSSFRGALKLIP